MFVIVISYIRPMSEVDQLLPAHRQFLQAQYAAGRFLMSGRKVPRTGGVILANAENRNEIAAIVQSDPFHVAGVAEYEIIEFVPSMTANAFGIFQETEKHN